MKVLDGFFFLKKWQTIYILFKKPLKKQKFQDDDEEIPKAFNRIITRILAVIEIMVEFSVTLLKIFQAIKEQNLWNVPIWMPLSTSLDGEKKRSVLGWEEKQKNWIEMQKEEDEGRHRGNLFDSLFFTENRRYDKMNK